MVISGMVSEFLAPHYIVGHDPFTTKFSSQHHVAEFAFAARHHPAIPLRGARLCKSVSGGWPSLLPGRVEVASKLDEGQWRLCEGYWRHIYIKRIEFNGIYRYILRYHFRFNSWNKLYADLNPNGLGLSIGLSAQLAAGGSQTIDLICYTASWSLMVVSERSEWLIVTDGRFFLMWFCSPKIFVWCWLSVVGSAAVSCAFLWD
jgi:hypothetical protein